MPQSYVEQQAAERERLAQVAQQQEARRQELAAHQQREQEFLAARAAKQAEREAEYQQILLRREQVARGEITPPAPTASAVRSLFAQHYNQADAERQQSEKDARKQERELAAQGVLSPLARVLPLPPQSPFSTARKQQIINPDDYS